MILLTPSIELKDGSCIIDIKGNPSMAMTYSLFSSEVVQLCQLLRKENAKCLHVIDINSLEDNFSIINFNKIAEIINFVDIPIQVYARYNDLSLYEQLLNAGIYRIVLDETILKCIGEFENLIKTYSQKRFVFRIEAENFENDKTTMFLIEVARSLNLERLIMHLNINQMDFDKLLKNISDFAIENKFKITLEYEFPDSEQLLKLKGYENLRIDSVIIGKSLFLNVFPCQEIWRNIESEIDRIQLNNYEL